MSDDQPQPRDRRGLLRRIEAGRAELDAAIAALDERQLTEIRDAQGWAVKDHLAHLAAWERSIVFLLQGRPRHEGLGVDEAAFRASDSEGFDRVNAIIQRQAAGQTLAETLTGFRAVHRELLATLDGLTDADLLRTYSSFAPDEPGEETGAPIIGWIVGNSYEHYEEHLGWIRALLQRSASA
jgi:hypothetical protein